MPEIVAGGGAACQLAYICLSDDDVADSQFTMPLSSKRRSILGRFAVDVRSPLLFDCFTMALSSKSQVHFREVRGGR